jgi:hypothetical protein
MKSDSEKQQQQQQHIKKHVKSMKCQFIIDCTFILLIKSFNNSEARIKVAEKREMDDRAFIHHVHTSKHNSYACVQC